MKFAIHRFGTSVELSAEARGLTVRGPSDVSQRQNWPADALAAPGGWRTAVEVEELLESGLAESSGGEVAVPYENFEAIRDDVRFIDAWAKPNPFLLKIDRKSDIGRPDFVYKYEYLLGGRPAHVERIGYYIRRATGPDVFILDSQMHSLVSAMDAFNTLTPEAKTPQASWLAFAKVKGCAKEVGATLDATLERNNVIVPSTIGLDMREDEDGALTFLPRCPELAAEDFHQVFERNPGAEKLYSLDRPGLRKVRVVLDDRQQEILRRMKRVRRVKGNLAERLRQDPAQAFDGIAGDVELPYGDRVIGIGDFPFSTAPRPANLEASMAALWEGEVSTPSDREKSNPKDTPDTKKYLLIETNEEAVREDLIAQAAAASAPARSAAFERPAALKADRSLRPHQEAGVRWLQTCSQIPGRTGVLLADDMGVGKTIQILTFLAWCIESGKFPDLSKPAPPFRPILIVAPLILLDTRTWEKEMENFFENAGGIFWPILPLHGRHILSLRRDGAEGRELEIGEPVLDLDRIRRHRVVITNYETIKNYQHSFARLHEGEPLWSFIVSDEAQEFKVPNTKISHAMKALKANLHIACTGTPVENQLLDLWNLYDALQQGLLSSAREFAAKFEGNAEASILELKRKLLFQQPHAYLLRRTKAEVADLPEKSVVRLHCAMSVAEIDAHRSLLKSLRSGGHLAVLQGFAQLYQHPALMAPNAEDLSVSELVSRSSKLRALLELLHEIRRKREKAIIFARLRAMQGILAKVLEAEFNLPVRIVNGETKRRAGGGLNPSGAKTRDGILQEFKSKPGFHVLVLSPFVAGVGLTIVEANHVVHYGRWWNPAVESQATDRAYRIGQTKPVTVYLPILHDPTGQVSPSFDERLDTLMERKQRLADDFLRPLPQEDQLSGELLEGLSAEAGEN
jgi:hypothetical protein